MRYNSKPVRIPLDMDDVVTQIANKNLWSKVTALAEMIKTSPIYIEFCKENRVS